MTGREEYLVLRISNQRQLEVVSQFVRKGGRFESLEDRRKWKDIVGYIGNKLQGWVDVLGKESAEAQFLKTPITSFEKLVEGNASPWPPIKRNDFIYLLVEASRGEPSDSLPTFEPIGLMRFGIRNLFMEHKGELANIPSCRCALDFYVRRQRSGFGHLLFSQVLEDADMKAYQMAIDKPTSLMLAFLEKHYHLGPPQKQHNHYVTFNNFF